MPQQHSSAAAFAGWGLNVRYDEKGPQRSRNIHSSLWKLPRLRLGQGGWRVKDVHDNTNVRDGDLAHEGSRGYNTRVDVRMVVHVFPVLGRRGDEMLTPGLGMHV